MTVIGTNAQEHELELPGDEHITVALAWSVATDVGNKRTHNEDSLVAASTIFAVADGMGGHSAGDIASKAVVTRLAEKAKDQLMSPELIMEALSEATEDISHASDERQLGVGTTATGIAMTTRSGQPYWIVFNVGDSRVYRFEDEELTQVTIDHSVVQELIVAGLISPEDAEHHPESSVITRAVGFNSPPVPDFWLIPVTSGSRMLVCSDGLTREVSDEGLRDQLAAGLSSDDTVHALISAALEGGGRDNVTAILVDVFASGLTND